MSNCLRKRHWLNTTVWCTRCSMGVRLPSCLHAVWQETRSNNIVVVPYTFDAAGDIPGLRIHFPQVFCRKSSTIRRLSWCGVRKKL